MTTQKRDRSSHYKRMNNRFFGKRTAAIALLLCTSFLGACTSEETNPNADSNVTAEEVAEQTEAVEGQSVTIRSKIKQKVGESSFTLDNKGEEILVVNVSTKTFIFPLNEDIEVQVTGKVQDFTLVDIEREYKLGLEPDVYTEFESKPTILANSIALAPDPGEVTQRPERFYDLAIAVEGEVEDVIDGSTFTLDEEKLFGAEDLLVIGVSTTNALEGETVSVTGRLRKFILTEFERDYDLTWDLDLKQKIEAEYKEKPVFVADSLYPSAQ